MMIRWPAPTAAARTSGAPQATIPSTNDAGAWQQRTLQLSVADGIPGRPWSCERMEAHIDAARPQLGDEGLVVDGATGRLDTVPGHKAQRRSGLSKSSRPDAGISLKRHAVPRPGVGMLTQGHIQPAEVSVRE